MTNIQIRLVDPETFEQVEEGQEGDLGLIIDGECECTFNAHTMPEHYRMIEIMFDEVYAKGKKDRSKEILRILDGKQNE